VPHGLTMHKHEDYKPQSEYRLAFGTRTNVFDFDHVDCFVVHKNYRWPRLTVDPQAHRMKLRLGPLGDCCRLLERCDGISRRDCHARLAAMTE
jgi:hypothetical protein